MTQRFSQQPSPATPGSVVRICFDFTGLNGQPVTVLLDWDPPQEDGPVTVTPDQPCFDRTIPANAKGLILTAQQSDDFGVAITP